MDQFPVHFFMKWNCIAAAMTSLWNTEAQSELRSNPGFVAKELFDWGEYNYKNVNVKIIEKDN